MVVGGYSDQVVVVLRLVCLKFFLKPINISCRSLPMANVTVEFNEIPAIAAGVESR